VHGSPDENTTRSAVDQRDKRHPPPGSFIGAASPGLLTFWSPPGDLRRIDHRDRHRQVSACACAMRSEHWQAFVRFQSRLHDWSAKNVLLIAVQYGAGQTLPPSSLVAFSRRDSRGVVSRAWQSGGAIIASCAGCGADRC
jgi:hypothetical protein